MSQEEPSENTRLLEPQQPPYVFGSSLARERKRRVRQFQCCVCTVFLVAFAAAVVITVAYTINLPLDNKANTTEANSSLIPINETSIPINSFLVLFDTLSWPIEDKLENNTIRTSHDLNQALQEGAKALNNKDKIEEKCPSLKIDSPSYRHQKVMSTSSKARQFSRKGYEIEGATQFFYRNNSNNRTTVKKICLTNFTDAFFIEMCGNMSLQCNNLHKYRSYNGSCNNLKHPSLYGVTYRPFRRGLPPDYADGISKPRVSKSGENLPTARMVSLEVHRPYYRNDPKFSVMLAVWGQFLDHDITATALSQKENGSSISCCQIGGIPSPECFPVLIEKNDPFAQYNVNCMEFVRSAPAPTCCLGPREQMNQASAFIDGSVVYGNDENKMISLRTLERGQLKMYVTQDNRTLLPISEDMNDGCNREEERIRGRYCFASGDPRANENLHLTSMHLIWARHHNFLAKELFALNPHWNDERVFQEARRILGAQMQHITYKEFLPILLGDKIVTKYGLTPKTQGYFERYNDSIDPSIANEFATAAFRFAHTIIPGLVKMLSRDSSNPEFIQMHKMLFDPFKLYQDGELDRALRGAMNTSIEASDSYFSNELKLHLFERSSENSKFQTCGLDLVSLNIQRGRDHGLQGYIFWKEHCGLNGTTNFEDLIDIMDHSSLANIKAIYRNVEDIDLYTGAISERPIEGSILGPTLTCLILDQFIRIKYGDRFWYENSQKPYGFSLEQLDEIRNTRLAGIICDNADFLQYIQPLVMERPRRDNQRIHCSKISKTNLTLWKETLEYLKVPTQNFQVKIV